MVHSRNMKPHKRVPIWTTERVAGSREALAIAANLGRDADAARKRRRLTHAALAARVGISRPRLTRILGGRGANAPLSTWVKLGIAVGRPLAVRMSRDIEQPLEPRDAGHLAAQELVLRFARMHGRKSNVELATRPWDPAHSVDVVLRDDRQRCLILIEIVNRAGDFGASFRASDRKAAELERLAILAGGDDRPYRICVALLIVDSAANRALVRRYPEVFRSRFPGSSVGLVRALALGDVPGKAPAVAWVNPNAGEIRPLRLPPRT